ncbi:MAG: hypothetical protein V7647_2165 [Acidobacteriota bacterium]|jgi:hypothetical protein
MDQRGTALICVLMVTTLLGTLSGAVALVALSETMTSANHGAAEQALYAADAALEATIGELRTADWRGIPGAAVSDRLQDASLSPRTPDGRILDLAALSAERQSASNAVFAPSPNRPVWHLFARGSLTDLAPAGVVVPPAYLLVWVADDGDEADGDAARDSNQVVMVRAEAFGAAGAHRSVQATVTLQNAPAGPPPEGGGPPPLRYAVRVLSWREVR